MITIELIEYIKQQFSKNVSKDLIISRLSQAGWHKEDIDEGFLSIESENVDIVTAVDTEMQSPVINNEMGGISLGQQEQGEVVLEPKIEVSKQSEEKNINTDINFVSLGIEDGNKVSTPLMIPTIQSNIEELVVEKEIEEKTPGIEIESFNLEIEGEKKQSSPIIPRIEPFKIDIPKEDSVFSHSLPVIDKEIKEELLSQSGFTNSSFSSIEKMKEDFKIKEDLNSSEFIPTINKNINKEIPPQSQIVSSITQNQKFPNINQTPIPNKGMMKDIVSKGAMISSYSEDLLSASKEKEVVVVKKRIPLIKWIIILFVVSFVGGMVFAFVEGYIKIPGSNFSLFIIKKDPRITIINAPKNLSNLKSYKVDTEINISSPAFANITTGLNDGNAVNNKDRESFIVKTKGLVNHIDDKLIFDYLLNLKISTLKNEIISDFKSDGSDLFVVVPDLSEILHKDAPIPTTVSFSSEQLGLIVPEFSSKVQDFIKKIDVYNILSSKTPLYVKNKIVDISSDFIKNLQYVEKGKENIHGVNTYHYELITDRTQTKKFLSSLSDLFITSLNEDQKKKLDEAIGSSTISSFEVWVGQNDNNIYQFKFTLNAPLSSILSLNDSGIAGSEVKLEWKTTYYDIDVLNYIKTGDTNINMEEFIRNIKDQKIKNIISEFNSQAFNFKNAIGSFGTRSNPIGSCTNPNPGSLFSPQGHKKGADSVISAIASSMNSLLLATNGAGTCYSTAKAWSLSAPLFSVGADPFTVNETAYSSFYCTDSNGNTKILKTPVVGTVCQ